MTTAKDQERKAVQALADADAITALAAELRDLIGHLVTPGSPREAALAQTKVDEAVLWAVKGLSD